jgi:hypothetical protein
MYKDALVLFEMTCMRMGTMREQCSTGGECETVAVEVGL